MKLATKLTLLITLAAVPALAQTNNIPQIQHVIIVIQENRTPDNLFGSDAFNSQRQLPGADLVQNGQCYSVAPYTVPLQSINLGNSCDPDHSHEPSWASTYNGGAMDGACKISTKGCTMSYPEYTYVQSSDVAPYFKIA